MPESGHSGKPAGTEALPGLYRPLTGLKKDLDISIFTCRKRKKNRMDTTRSELLARLDSRPAHGGQLGSNARERHVGSRMRRSVTLFAVAAVSLVGMPAIYATAASAATAPSHPAHGVSLSPARTEAHPHLEVSRLATAGRASGLSPAAVSPLASLSPACYGDSRNMATVGGPFDPMSYGAFYNCSKAEWTFEVQTADTWAASSFGDLQIGINTTGAFPTSSCDFQYLAFAIQEGPGLYGAEVSPLDSSCNPAGTAVGASLALTGRTVAISFPWSAIGDSPSLAWNGGLQSLSEMAGTAGQDFPAATAIDGPLTGGVLDSIPGPSPTATQCASATSAEIASTPNSAAAASALKKAGFSGVHIYSNGFVSFTGNAANAKRALTAAGVTSQIAPGHAFHPTTGTTTPPNDPDYSQQWDLPAVNAAGAWSVTTGNNIVVADIDTGVDYTNTDLASNLVDGYDEVTNLPMGPGTTETGNTDTGQSAAGHGTAVAGVITAVTNNGEGLASLGWNTKVEPVKVNFDDTANSSAQIAAGIEWAANNTTNPVKIINLSLGGTCADSTIETAILYAQGKGILVVAAAGNDALGQGFDLTPTDLNYNDAPFYPASEPGVLSVGATGHNGYRAAYSNTGDAAVMAPGGSADGVNADDIPLEEQGSSSITYEAGTSFASPEAAATAALIWSVNPNLTFTQVSELITGTATDLGPGGNDIEYGAGLLNAGAAVADTPPTTAGFGTFVSLPPSRILDTRFGTGTAKQKLGAGQTLTLQVTGAGGIPASGVTAVVLNTTVTDPTAPSYLTVWPTGQSQPTTSNINFSTNQTVPNLVTVKVGTGGDVSFFNAVGSIDLLADVAGYYIDGTGTAGSTFVSLPPTRILDTRSTGGPIGQGATRNLQVTGLNGVPPTATAVVANVTVTGGTAASYVTVFPGGTAVPNASNLNFTKSETVPNLAIVQLGSSGNLGIYNSLGSTQVIVDLQGYFTAAGDTTGSRFFPLVDHRILDTRFNVDGIYGPIRGGTAVNANVVGQGGVLVGPSNTIGASDGPSAVVVNTTVADGTENGYLTVYPTGTTLPNASNLNFAAGEAVANLTTAKIGSNGQDNFYNSTGTVDAIADVVGYYGAAGT
jgi:subtilisin family serine protease